MRCISLTELISLEVKTRRFISPFSSSGSSARILEYAGAVKVLTEPEADPELIYKTLWSLLQSPETLAEMGKNARAKAQPNVLENIYQTLRNL